MFEYRIELMGQQESGPARLSRRFYSPSHAMRIPFVTTMSSRYERRFLAT